MTRLDRIEARCREADALPGFSRLELPTGDVRLLIDVARYSLTPTVETQKRCLEARRALLAEEPE